MTIRIINLLILLALVSSCAPQIKKADPVITIPIILFLTGNQAQTGEEILRAFEFAKSDFEQSHPSRNVKLLVEDSGDDPKKGLIAYDILKTKGDFPLFVSTGDAVTAALLPQTQEDGKLLVATTVAAPETSGPNMFRGFLTSTQQGRSIGKFIASQNKKRVAVLALDNPFSPGFISSLKEAIGKEFVAQEKYQIADLDSKTQLLKIKDTNPDALVIAGFGPTYPLIFKQALDVGINAQIYTHDAIDVPQYIDAAGGYDNLQGVILLSASFDLQTPSSEMMKDFANRFEMKHNAKPSLFSGYAYDTLMITLEALDKCPSTDSQTLSR